MKHKHFLISWGMGILLVGLMGACTPTDNLIYLREKEESPTPPDTVQTQYRLKKGDMVYIDVESADFTGQPELFRRPQQTSTRIRGGGNPIGDPSTYLSSYSISDSGYVRLPVIGKLKLEGLTLAEANDLVQKRVSRYLKEGVAQVKLMNFKVTIFGEIQRPGSYQVYQPGINMMDLISHAGDVTPYANRQRVMLIRQQSAQQDTTVLLDLTDRQVLNSPYFYLKPGDQVYVKPYLLSKTTGFATIPWGTIFSAISSTILIINFISN